MAQPKETGHLTWISTGFGLILIVLGVYFEVHQSLFPAIICSEIGILLFAVLGAELLHRRLLLGETLREVRKAIAESLECDRNGLPLLAYNRKECKEYNEWAYGPAPKRLDIVGRAALDKVARNIERRTSDGDLSFSELTDRAAARLLDRLRNGTRMRVLLLDPTSPLVKTFGADDNPSQPDQGETDVLQDISNALAVCKRLADMMKSERRALPGGALLSIKVSGKIPYFSYYRCESHTDGVVPEASNDRVIVGFYFRFRGDDAPAHEVVDPRIKEVFQSDLNSVFSDGTNRTVLECHGGHEQPTPGSLTNLNSILKTVENALRAKGQRRGEQSENGPATKE